jgi:hypothetical protein
MKTVLTPVQILAIQALVQEEGVTPYQIRGLAMKELIPPMKGNKPAICIDGILRELELQTWIFIQNVCEEKPYTDGHVFVLDLKTAKERGEIEISISDMIPHLHVMF